MITPKHPVLRKVLPYGLIILFLFQLFLSPLSSPARAGEKTFSDIENHWARDSIERLVQLGIVSGFDNGTFQPEGKVTREQFVKMLIEANRSSLTIGSDTFVDVPSTRWSYRYIETAVKSGIILEDETGPQFLPGTNITRQEMALFIARALELTPDENSLNFKDIDQIHPSYRGLIGGAIEAGIISGYPNGTFRPDESATRAQAAVMIIRMLDYQDRVLSELNPEDQVMRVPMMNDPVALDPGLIADSLSGTFVENLFEGLTRLGKDGKPYPALAKEIQISDDLMTYTFTLRESQWSNGDPVTAHDFEYAWKRVLDPEFESIYAFQLFIIKNALSAKQGEVPLDDVGIKALDDRTLQVTLEEPAPYFLHLTSFYTFYPVHQDAVESSTQWGYSGENLISNGPFKLSDWTAGKQIELVKNEHYWDAEHVYLNKAVFSVVPDPDVAYAEFQKGAFDWFGEPLHTPKGKMLIEKEAHITSIPGIYWYEFNTDSAPFQNKKMRKAFAYAIDRDQLFLEIGFDHIPATSIIPSTMEGGGKPYFTDTDLETARELFEQGLEEMGLNDASQLPEITITYSDSVTNETMTRIIADQWEKAFNIRVKTEGYPWAEYLSRLRQGDFQIARMGWMADFHDPISFLALFTSYNRLNNTGWENSQYDNLLVSSNYETDPVKRMALLSAAEQIIMDEMPVIPIYEHANVWFNHNAVKGGYLDAFSNLILKSIYIDKP
ncbi:MAG: S-layer homology domain-containing protein [Bacillaceae bacterium]|nr:S-layer homology domain-containing protein [Bacillaceae bacterium]